jgi:hypothetical protein
MIRHKLPNKTKSATVAEPKLFHQLNNPYGVQWNLTITNLQDGLWPLIVPRRLKFPNRSMPC